MLGLGEFRSRRFRIGQLPIGCKPGIEVAPEPVTDLGLGVRWQHVDSLPGRADRVDLFHNQVTAGH